MDVTMWQMIYGLSMFFSFVFVCYGSQKKISSAEKKVFSNLGLKMQSFIILLNIIKTLEIQIMSPRIPSGF
jgi:hypothetical protein